MRQALTAAALIVISVLGLAGCGGQPARQGVTQAPAVGFPIGMPHWLPGPSRLTHLQVVVPKPPLQYGEVNVTIASRRPGMWMVQIQETYGGGGLGHLQGSGPNLVGQGIMTVCGQPVSYVAFWAPPYAMAVVSIVSRDRLRYSVQGIHLDLRQVLRIAYSIAPPHHGQERACRLPATLPVRRQTSTPPRQHPAGGSPFTASPAFHWAAMSPAPIPPGAVEGMPPALVPAGQYLITDYAVQPGLTIWAGELAADPQEGFVAIKRGAHQPQILLVPSSGGWVVLTRENTVHGIIRSVQIQTEHGATGVVNVATARGYLNGSASR